MFISWKLAEDTRYKIKRIIPSHNPVENNLHHIINDFREGDYDFWLNIDADNPPMRNPLDLVELNKDIIGLPTPVVHFDSTKLGDKPVYFNVYKYVDDKDAYTEWSIQEGLQEVDAIGGGCFLIKRDVFLNKEMQKGAFTRKLNEDGTVNKGNDISFSERAKEQGFKIYAHFGYACRHYNEVDAIEMIQQWTSYKGGNG